MALKIIKESIVLLDAGDVGPPEILPEDPPADGTWQLFAPGADAATINGKISVVNNSADRNLYVNTESLLVKDVAGCVDGYSLTGKITATIVVAADNTVSISDVSTTLTVRDASICLDDICDTRATRDDPRVNQFNNYGLLIDGSVNPITTGLIQFNGTDRFKPQDASFFNYLQPLQHHTNAPADGINVYSFALHPEQIQPTGSANLSRIDTTQLVLTVEDSTKKTGLPDLRIYGSDNKLYVFGRNKNVFRVISGMGGVAYSS
jgi:hypothetical protein